MLVIYGVSRYQSYLNTAITLLREYKGLQPFTDFSKSFFSRNKKYGSTDRKKIVQLCYCYFRLGRSMLDMSIEERILTGLFLCSWQFDLLLEALNPALNAQVGLMPNDKYKVLGIQHSLADIFPWTNELSHDMEPEKFNQSFLIQPQLYLRIRPGKEQVVRNKLRNAEVAFAEMNSHCIALANASRIDTIIELNKEAVVQDYNSQRIGEMIRLAIERPSLTGRDRPWKVWDCCAASGGKSIMANDIMGDMELTVSDIRKTILINLEKRFAQAGIKNYKESIVDLTLPVLDFEDHDSKSKGFDLVMADVPCTGSGTWGRTPEQLFYFEKNKIDEYAGRQRKIVSNIIPLIHRGGYLLYSTCSVFKKENEDIAEFVQQSGLEMIKTELLKGYDKKADSLFAALFRKGL